MQSIESAGASHLAKAWCQFAARDQKGCEHRRVVTISPDGATGWSQPRFDEQLLESVCMAGIVRVRMPQGDKPGVIAFSNPHNLSHADGNEIAGKSRNRINVTIKLNDDEGQSWSASIHDVSVCGWLGRASSQATFTVRPMISATTSYRIQSTFMISKQRYFICLASTMAAHLPLSGLRLSPHRGTWPGGQGNFCVANAS